MKPQCKVMVTAGKEVHEKLLSCNQPMINYLAKNYGKESKDWIGKTVNVTVKLIKGNNAIVPII